MMYIIVSSDGQTTVVLSIRYTDISCSANSTQLDIVILNAIDGFTEGESNSALDYSPVSFEKYMYI